MTPEDLDWLRETFATWGGLTQADRSGSNEEDAQFVAEIDRGCKLIDKLKTVQSDAFDLGFKAAGGTVVPNAVKNFSLVEMTMDREEIDALAAAAEYCIAEIDFEKERPLLERFIERISIYRRKK